MKLKASQDYALRMCCYLAKEGGRHSSLEISDATQSPRDYLIQIAQHLRNAGIIEAAPGKHGGYLLAMDARDISLFDVVHASDLTPGERRWSIEGNAVELMVGETLQRISIHDMAVGL